MAWTVNSPLRDSSKRDEVLANLRSVAFTKAMNVVFLGALCERSGETPANLAGGTPQGVLGKYIQTGLEKIDPYGDPADPTLPSGAPGQLDARAVELVLIAILTAESSKLNLAFHIFKALQAGASVSEVEATIALAGRYTGAENAMDASAVLRFVEASLVAAVNKAAYTSDTDPQATTDAKQFFDKLRKLDPGF